MAGSRAMKRFTLAYLPRKPWSSTRFCQIAIALRPRAAASSMTSRYGSHALADGARPGRCIATAAPASVDSPTPVAGFAPSESVDTSLLVAGFGGHTRGLPPAARTATPTARR